MLRLLVISLICLSACTVGPSYRRPTFPVPQSFRAPDPLPAAQADSIADLKWFEVFKDEQLQALIRHALERNYDLRDGAARVLGECRIELNLLHGFCGQNTAGNARLSIIRIRDLSLKGRDLRSVAGRAEVLRLEIVVADREWEVNTTATNVVDLERKGRAQ